MIVKEMIEDIVCDSDLTKHGKAEAILNLRYPNGNPVLAVLDKDQTRPRNSYSETQPLSRDIVNDTQQTMINAGYRKVIQEEK
jgi:hypothetical protein